MLPVTPFAGVWIEIFVLNTLSGKTLVTPFAGVWIEIRSNKTAPTCESGHPLRGGVD